MIIIDYSAIAISSVFSQNKSGKIEESFLRHTILNSLRMYNLKYRDKYGKMIIACDGGSWRKDYYSQYKAARRKNREESTMDWKEIFRIVNSIKAEIDEHLPYTVIQTDKAEADDVIAALVSATQEFGNHEPVMIVSADKDFIQLQRYDNVSQWSTMTKKLITDKNPSRYLLEHILKGDSGDGVPNVLSGDNTFTDGIRQTPLRAAKIDEWIAAQKAGTLQSVMPEETYRNYIRNRTVIDLECVPSTIRDAILTQYAAAPVKNNSKILNYLIANRCNILISCASEFFTK